MTANNPLHAKLDAFYDTMQRLTLKSSPEEFSRFASFFDEKCIVYLQSMRERSTPSLGRQGVIDGLKDNLKDYYLDERRVLSRSISDDGLRIFCEMENRLVVHGRVLDPFPETAVVVFDKDGLITSFKLYSCRSHLVRYIQEETGRGPYTKESLEFDAKQNHEC